VLKSFGIDAMRQIRTERLILDPVSHINLKLLWELMREPDLREYQDIPRLPFDRFADRLERRSPRLGRGSSGRFEWLVLLRSTGEALGWISIRFQDRTPNRGELGYSILLEHRGNGYATDSVRAITDLVFRDDVVDYVDAYCMPENMGSRRVLERSGLHEVQRLSHGAVIRGVPVDVLRYEISAQSWQRAERMSRSAQDHPFINDNLPLLTLGCEEQRAER
jgi:RimJ/RimL family protein N-acetyltransferase